MIFVLAGVGVVSCIVFVLHRRFFLKKKPEKLSYGNFLNVTAEEVAILANTGYSGHLEHLMHEMGIEKDEPGFYLKYTELKKKMREDYFRNLLDVIARDKQDRVARLLEEYPDFSVQDVLLVMLMDANLDNKTIARFLFVSVDTLKKRKTRLKAKFNGEKVVESES